MVLQQTMSLRRNMAWNGMMWNWKKPDRILSSIFVMIPLLLAIYERLSTTRSIP